MDRPRRRSVPVVAGALALTCFVGAPPAGALDALPGTCVVDNVTQGLTYGPNGGGALENALAAAAAGDVLEVAGLCSGYFSMGSTGPLTVRGVGGATPTELTGFVGLASVSLSRVTINGGTVHVAGESVLSHVKIVHSGFECGQALLNKGGDLLIRRSTIARNQGAGITNSENGGRLTARHVRIVHNDDRCVHSFGGGILNERGKMFLADVLVAGNKANYGGGIQNSREMEITDSHIRDNVARLSIAGGILNDGNLTLTTSEITGNRAGESGGGIYNRGTATLIDTVVADNQPDDCFGVVC